MIGMALISILAGAVIFVISLKKYSMGLLGGILCIVGGCVLGMGGTAAVTVVFGGCFLVIGMCLFIMPIIHKRKRILGEIIVTSSVVVLLFGEYSLGENFIYFILVVGYIVAMFFFIKWIVSLTMPSVYQQKVDARIRFFRICREHGITSKQDLTTEVKKGKFINLAKIYGFYSDEYLNDAESLYKEIESEISEYERKIKFCNEKKKIKEMREKEEDLLESISEYSKYIGRDKRIAMLSEKYHELYNKYKELSTTAKGAENFGIEKERDWAIMGGIASGLAGGAAGLATALDVQAQNQQIRENNAKQRVFNETYLAPIKNTMLNESYGYLEKAKKIEEEIAATKLKIVSEVPADEVFKNITIKNKRIYVTSTGALKVSASFEVKDSTVQYFDDNIEWVIDGTFIANIYDDDRKIGSAELVAPLEGIFEIKRFTGIYITDSFGHHNYSCEIKPKHIWVMEK